jgi:hypothetical protein
MNSMRVVASLLVLAVLAAAGLLPGRAPELRAVDAGADSIRRADGALLAAFEGKGRALLQWVRPLTLRPASPPLRLREPFVADAALSPDGGTLAVGSETQSRIEFIDLRRWRSTGSMPVPGARPGGYRGVHGLVWTHERRLLALAGPPYMRASPVVLDPVRRRVVRRSSVRSTPIRWERAGDRLVFLSVPEGRRSRAARPWLSSYDAEAGLRRLRLDRIVAGSWQSGRGPWHTVEPGLATTADRAYVVAADGRLVAEVDLSTWRVYYHQVVEARSAWQRLGELIEPPAYAKGPLESSVRTAQVLPGGAIAVSGEDMDATDDPHDVKTTAYGVRLIDPANWTWRTVDRDAQEATVAGGALLARRWSCRCINALPSMGVRGYDTAGKLRFARFSGAGVIVFGAAGDYAYVGVRPKGARRVHVIELDTGKTVRVLPYRELRLLEPRRR